MLASLSAKQKAELSNWINTDPAFLSPSLLGPSHYTQLAQKLGISGHQVPSILSPIVSTLNLCIQENDNVDDVLDDLSEIKLIDEANLSILKEFFSSISGPATKIHDALRISSYETFGLPYLRSYGYTTDLRLVNDNLYDTDDPIEEYQSTPVGLLPMAIIQFISSDNNNQVSISFQVNFKELEDIVNTLLACQKDMRKLQQIQQKIESSLLSESDKNE